MGRIKQYDEQNVLDKAMLSFWKHGFEKTTIRQLETDMGINQFSIYASFQNKQQLFQQVLSNYQEKLKTNFLKDLKKSDANLEDVEKFLLKFAFSIRDQKIPNSCMMVRSAANLESYDPKIQNVIINFFLEMKQEFVKAIKNSISQTTMPDVDVELEAEYLVGIAQSISVYSKLNSKAKIKNYITHALAKIK